MKKLTIYTDGSCLSNGSDNAPGGWGAILIYKNNKKTISGGIENTTSNRAELVATIEALSIVKEPCQIDLYTDSSYIVNTMTKNWKRNANTDLWDKLEDLTKNHDIDWIWVKGHNNDKYNELVNSLAQTQSAKVSAGLAKNIASYGEKKINTISEEVKQMTLNL